MMAPGNGSSSPVPRRVRRLVGSRLPWRRGVLPLPSLESQAPSARVTTASITLSQQDYDRLKKEGKLDETTQYLTT